MSITPLRLDLTDHTALERAKRDVVLEAPTGRDRITAGSVEDEEEALETATSEASG